MKAVRAACRKDTSMGPEDVEIVLAGSGKEYSIYSFEESTRSCELAARALGVEEGQIVKSVVVKAAGAPVLVLMPGDLNVDLKKLKGVLGVKKLRVADAETVLEATGYPVGAVPPVAHAGPLRIIADRLILKNSTVYPSAGSDRSMFSMGSRDLVDLTGAAVEDVSKPKGDGS